MESRTLTATTEDIGLRLDSFLAGRLEGTTRSAAVRLIENGCVTVNGKAAGKSVRIAGGETVCVELPEAEEPEARPEDIPLDIVYEDGDVIVVNKPVGMVVHPAPGHPDGTLVTPIGIPAIVATIIAMNNAPFTLRAISTPLSTIARIPSNASGVNLPRATNVSGLATTIPAFLSPINAMNIPMPTDIE